MKRILSFLLVVCMVLTLFPALTEQSYAATYYANGKAFPNSQFKADGSNPYCNDGIAVGSGTHYCCFAYAIAAYKYIWGVDFSKYGDAGKNNDMLRNLSASERTTTVEHVKAFFNQATPGANVRFTSSASEAGNPYYTSDEAGHSLIFLGVDSGNTGAYMLEGNYDDHGRSRIQLHTWDSMVRRGYLKYIIWPGAEAYSVKPADPVSGKPTITSAKTEYAYGEYVTLNRNTVENTNYYWLHIYHDGNDFLSANMPDTTWGLSDLQPGLYEVFVSVGNSVSGEITSECYAFRVLPAELKLVGIQTPGTLMQGESFSPKGSIQSPSGLSYVTAGVFDVYDNLLIGSKDLRPYTKYFDVSSVQMDFSSLNPGVYNYKVNAMNVDGSYDQITKAFVVLTKEKTVDNGTFIFQCISTNCAVDISGHSTGDNANVCLATRDDSAFETFYIRYDSNGFYSIQNVASGKMLDVDGAQTTDGTNIQLYSANNHDAQRFQILPCGDAYCIVPKIALSSCIDIVGGKQQPGQNIQLYTANCMNAQRFWLDPVPADFRPHKIDFDLNGGEISSAKLSCAIDGFNAERGWQELIIYNVSGTMPMTNKYGREAVVLSNGKVADIREEGSTTQLEIPQGGFVVSAHDGSGGAAIAFVNSIEAGDWVGYDSAAKTVSNYGSDQNAYLFENTYVNDGAQYGAFPTPSRDGYTFEGWFTSPEGGDQITSASVYSAQKLYAHWALNGPQITTQPTSVSADAGKKATFSVAATGDGLSYQWQYSADNGATWHNSAAASGRKATLSFTANTAYDARLFRCVVTDANGKQAVSDTARLTVTSVPKVTAQPQDTSAAVGARATFSVRATGTGLSYQWQYSKNGSDWANSTAASAKTATLAITTKASFNGRLYRCVVTDANGKQVISNAARLTVTGGPQITAQPTAKSAAAGKKVTFSVKATGTGLTYQWQYSTDNGATWRNSTSTSAKTATVTITAKASFNGRLYRCVVTDSSGRQAASDAVKLTVK